MSKPEERFCQQKQAHVALTHFSSQGDQDAEEFPPVSNDHTVRDAGQLRLELILCEHEEMHVCV